ncbi:MAG: serine/threonine-protein kinase [Proteobacteria bacterium]|nr:serine/threonine-protein kinase [Pseudomonadota bacterium]
MIQVGEVLDKYELLERVGQGGMAIVYRGLDRSLKRVVAVKILHGHLSDYQEARDRFEREAQAVAKLRHDNILEIFDFAAREGSPGVPGVSYIVTEFIQGQTLKQLITERPIGFPEIGAMLIVQVCRALVHAHAAKILHRDIKPENIMIRADGVVKLMDFGISHMVDLERLTITGQLLGSPAYMAPEHVEGRPLDYRTDVFAVGIVLYQLCAGKLPFEGKNPHEVLKRIAECKFVDPRQVNPRIGNRLGRIILRAMAARPEDRFPAIGEMLVALEAYLAESGLVSDKVVSELGRYINSPGAYEQALTTRLVDALTREGTRLLDADERAASLDVFDRVLTIEPQNEKVLAILDGLNARQRVRKIAIGGLAALAIGAGAYAIHLRAGSMRVDAPPSPDAGSPLAIGPDTQIQHDPPFSPDAGAIELDAATPRVDDAAPMVVVRAFDAAPRDAVASPDAMLAIETRIAIAPETGKSQYRIGTGGWVDIAGGAFTVSLDHEVDIEVRDTSGCCVAQQERIRPGQASANIQLAWAMANIVAECALPGVSAFTVDGTRFPMGVKPPIEIGSGTFNTKRVKVAFIGDRVATQAQDVDVTAGKSTKVTCVSR